MVKLKLNERIRELEAEVKQFKEKQEEPDPEVTIEMSMTLQAGFRKMSRWPNASASPALRWHVS